MAKPVSQSQSRIYIYSLEYNTNVKKKVKQCGMGRELHPFGSYQFLIQSGLSVWIFIFYFFLSRECCSQVCERGCRPSECVRTLAPPGPSWSPFLSQLRRTKLV